MAYWWVNQGNSYRLEHNGGFIWAPIINTDGNNLFHWENLGDVKEGDIIFSNVNGKINNIGIALNDAYLSEKPIGHANVWQNEGRRVDIKYYKANDPKKISEVHSASSEYLPNKYSPITGKGDRANQGYLFEFPDKAGDIILPLLDVPYIANINPNRRTASNTTKDAIIQARVGQGKFRKDLIDRWFGKCSITSFPVVSLLIASHIQPWAISTNEERLNPDNGLLLSPNYNTLFDKFLISFSDAGELIKSDRITWENLSLLNVNPDSKLNGLNAGNKKFLKFHLREMLSKNTVLRS